MSPDSPSIHEHHPSLRMMLDFAVDAAWQAGKITLEYFQTGTAVEQKADASPVTLADRRAEQKLRECIQRAFPDHGILGEEFGEVPGVPLIVGCLIRSTARVHLFKVCRCTVS